MKIGIIYWSGTGNTEAMAKAIAEGVQSAGAGCDVLNISDGEPDISAYDKCMYGCPAMGAEELEEAEFAPFWESIKGKLAGKDVALFGSYEWADGEWMDTWKADAEEAGAKPVTLIAYDNPDDEAIQKCKDFGASFAK